MSALRDSVGGVEQPDAETVWKPAWPCPVARVLQVHRRGAGDPTYCIDERSRHWRGVRTPHGPATLVVVAAPVRGEVHAGAWGPGAEWVIGSLPRMLGADDDPTGFEPRHPVVARAWRHHPHVRFGRTDRVWEALLPAIIEQKVTGQEAFAGFRRIVHRFGERAPGPAPSGLWVQPAPEQVAAIPSWAWLRAHVDPARSRTVVTAARVADSLERLASVGDGEVVEQRLTSLRGIGVWTAAEVRTRALGDADAVSFGDYHVAKDVGWALTGEPFDDDEMAAHLEPWRPHRGRVVALLALAGHHRPRRGPRMAPRTHLPTR